MWPMYLVSTFPSPPIRTNRRSNFASRSPSTHEQRLKAISEESVGNLQEAAQSSIFDQRRLLLPCEQSQNHGMGSIDCEYCRYFPPALSCLFRMCVSVVCGAEHFSSELGLVVTHGNGDDDYGLRRVGSKRGLQWKAGGTEVEGRSN